MKKWNLIQNQPLLCQIFKEPTIMSFKKGKSWQRTCFGRAKRHGFTAVNTQKGIVGGFEFTVFQRSLKELAGKAVDICLRVLKESNKSRFDHYSQEQCIELIPDYLSGLSRAHFFRQPFSKQLQMCACQPLQFLTKNSLRIQKGRVGFSLCVLLTFLDYFFIVPCNQQGNIYNIYNKS